MTKTSPTGRLSRRNCIVSTFRKTKDDDWNNVQLRRILLGWKRRVNEVQRLSHKTLHQNFILTISAAVIATAPSSALYSRCFKYNSKENLAGSSFSLAELGVS